MKTPPDVAATDVTLEPFASLHLELLAEWLRAPHVAPWFPDPEDQLARAADPPPGGQHAVIAEAGRPVGYIRWQSVDRATLDAVGLHDVPAGAVDADLFLGAASGCGRGVGRKALELLVDRLRQDPSVPLLGLTSSVDNVQAHRAFERAGFVVMTRYQPPGFGPSLLFVRHLRTAADPR